MQYGTHCYIESDTASILHATPLGTRADSSTECHHTQADTAGFTDSRLPPTNTTNEPVSGQCFKACDLCMSAVHLDSTLTLTLILHHDGTLRSVAGHPLSSTRVAYCVLSLCLVMPALTTRDANVPLPPTARKDGKGRPATRPPPPAPPAPGNPLVVQRCTAFLSKLQTQYDTSQAKSTHSVHPPLPDLASHIATLASDSATLLHVASAYEVVGHWLHNCEKHTQAAAILRNAMTVYEACNAAGRALLARIDAGRALNAAAVAQHKTEPSKQTEVEQAQQHWLTVEQQVRGKDLRLESYACFHHGQLYAQLASQCWQSDMERSRLLFERAMEVWAALADIPSRYAPTVRAADSEPMCKHRQHLLRVEDGVQTAAQRCGLYGHPQQQVARLRWLAECLSSALLHLPAAVCWLQCAIVAATERDSSGARNCLSQAETSRSQPTGISATTLGRDRMATYELRYTVLHFQLSVRLHTPPSTLPPLPPPLATFLSQPLTSLAFQHQILRAQLLSIVSHIELRRGRISDSESRCRQEYKVWSSCLRRLFASSAAPPAPVPSLSAADWSAVIAAQPALTHEQYTVVGSYIDCLYRYARLIERQGQPLLCIAHLSKATAVCEALDEQRQRRRLERLRWRVKVKLAWQHDQLDGTEAEHKAAEKERWEVAADEAVQSLEAAVAGEQSSGNDGLLHIQLSEELADACMRRGQLLTASSNYQHALTTVSQLVDERPTVSAVRLPEPVKRKVRPANTRAVKQRQPAEEHREAEPNNQHTVLQQARLQAKLASIALSSLTVLQRPSAPSTAATSSLEQAIASLSRSSVIFQQQQQQLELAWAAYWQAVAERTDAASSPSSSRSVWFFPTSDLTRSAAVVSPHLRSRCTSSCSSLLYSAIASSFSSSPPYVSRLLLSSLSSCLGLSSTLDAVFALNASLGIATRHCINRTLRLRAAATSTDDSLSEQLSALQLKDESEKRTCETEQRGSDRSMFVMDGGVEADRERFETEFVARLPVEWAVVTMALSDDRRHLLVSRVQSPHHGRSLILLRLPLWSSDALPASGQAESESQSSAAPPPRTTRGKGKSAAASKLSPAFNPTSAATTTAPFAATDCSAATSSSYHSVLSELCGVLEASGRVNNSSLRSQHTCTYDERKEWWTERERLDDRMRRLVQRMEDDWFGAWKGVLCGDDRDSQRRQHLHEAVLRVAYRMRQLLGETAAVDASSPLSAYIRVLLQSSVPLSARQLQSAVAYLLGWTDIALESEVAVQARQSSRSTADRQLLISVCATIETERQLLHPPSTSHSAPRSRLPVILLLSSQLQRLPFESMPVLEGQSVTRMPSWLQLLPHLPPQSSTLQAGVCTSLSLASHSYILNPGSDLPRTESTFTPLLPALGLTNGLTATQPSASAFLTSLASDLFLYIGHGSGDQYVQPHHIATSAQAGGVCLLMGCSSARGRGESVEYEGCEGMVQALLQAGAKCVVGNLWDVTDGECDRFAVRLLEQLTSKHDTTTDTEQVDSKQRHTQQEAKPVKRGRGKRVVMQVEAADTDTPREAVCEMVASSRSACRLRYLMGASPVVYGLPDITFV